MILEKKKSKKFLNKLQEAQKQGKINKQLRKEKKKRLLAEKRKQKLIEEKKKIKREKEKERRKNKKILNNNENDKRILNCILDVIFNDHEYRKHFDFTYKSQLHEAKDIIMEVIKHIKYAIPWRANDKFSYSTIYSIYKKLIKHDIICKTYIKLLEKYIEVDTEEKLKIQSTDVTIVPNKYGSSLVEYNGHKKRKCSKSSQIHDSKGIVLGFKLDKGAKHDSKIFLKHLDINLLINKELNNKHKKYMLADSGYDSDLVKTKLRNLGYMDIIYPNKRNNKIKLELNDNDKEIYKNRIKSTEHSYSTEKTHRRVNIRYDRNIETFSNAFYLSFIDLILKKQ